VVVAAAVAVAGIAPVAGRISVVGNKARWTLAAYAGVGLAFVFGTRALTQPVEKPIAVTMAHSGITPLRIQGRKGEPMRLAVTTADEEHCFAVDEFRIEKRVLPGKTITIELTPDRAGRFEIYCCLEPADTTPRGQLIVIE
jgi:heme/copper-type cytochrome/quinol oxidase subunit 2